MPVSETLKLKKEMHERASVLVNMDGPLFFLERHVSWFNLFNKGAESKTMA